MTDTPVVHIVDDDPAVRDSLGVLLEVEGFNVQTHSSARAFLDSVEPDEKGCVLTDVRMPEMSGIELLAKMKERHLTLPAIVITAYADVPLAVHAMKLGAVDLLEKPVGDETLLASVRHALTHGNDEKLRRAETQTIRTRLEGLTERENEVLTGLLMGRPNNMIANDLGLSTRLVEALRASVMAKMKAASLAELVRMSLTAEL